MQFEKKSEKSCVLRKKSFKLDFRAAARLAPGGGENRLSTPTIALCCFYCSRNSPFKVSFPVVDIPQFRTGICPTGSLHHSGGPTKVLSDGLDSGVIRYTNGLCGHGSGFTGFETHQLTHPSIQGHHFLISKQVFSETASLWTESTCVLRKQGFNGSFPDGTSKGRNGCNRCMHITIVGFQTTHYADRVADVHPDRALWGCSSHNLDEINVVKTFTFTEGHKGVSSVFVPILTFNASNGCCPNDQVVSGFCGGGDGFFVCRHVFTDL